MSVETICGLILAAALGCAFGLLYLAVTNEGERQAEEREDDLIYYGEIDQ